jgi:hypothetical protein
MTYTPHFNQAGEARMVDVGAKAVNQGSGSVTHDCSFRNLQA